ncbi:TetR/AcrR family transcriptional regulator [Streptomyces otsuchiensis]|uniref:TetR/AcrR family transcriptional regulator n=1 Tax=Streptomyces otsuchiensis TaxID=2681388 RepID=UPI0014770AE0|nr:TetR/AcrR family transcriptional regulator [Streptomyces otsuchiensis]
MPKVVDHDQRRRAIARGFQRLLAAGGLGRTSFVRVAEEAGTSVGLIQHYFAGRDDLLRFAYEDCVAALDHRVDTRVRQGEADGLPISELLTTALAELLPLDTERTVEHRVRQNLLTASLNVPSLAEVARAAEDHLWRRVSTAVENGKECGEVESAVDAGAAATTLLAVTDGLAARLSLGSDAHEGGGEGHFCGGEGHSGDGDRHEADRDGDKRADATAPPVIPAAVLRPVVGLYFTGSCRHHQPPQAADQPVTAPGA